jgi:hypothetical protein
LPPVEQRSIERDALYYPYIHIRSVEWLKRALLIFPHVARIVPNEYIPSDKREISEFEDVMGRWKKPLLRRANLNSIGVQNAQFTLLKLLAEDNNNPAWRKKFIFRGYDFITSEEDEFLIHPNKPLYELVAFLQDNGLMWGAKFGSPSSDCAVHPTIGNAIMSTIAMACAGDEGFDVVTDEPRLHYEIADDGVEGLYRSLFRTFKPQQKVLKATERKLHELIVFQQCDVTKLTPKAIGELGEDRVAIDLFRSVLAKIASGIPEMQDEAAFKERLFAVACTRFC